LPHRPQTSPCVIDQTSNDALMGQRSRAHTPESDWIGVVKTLSSLSRTSIAAQRCSPSRGPPAGGSLTGPRARVRAFVGKPEPAADHSIKGTSCASVRERILALDMSCSQRRSRESESYLGRLFATKLSVSYMAEQISIFGIVVGIVLLLTGIGLVILAFAVFGRY
jgi:hypothetical protein